MTNKVEGDREGEIAPAERESVREPRAPQPRAMFWIVAAVAVVTYANTLAGGFTFDDTWILLENPLVQDLGRIGDLLTSPYWGDRSAAGLYRPLTSLSFAIQGALHGMTPFGFHLVNVILHAVASVLVASVAARLSGSRFVAAASGILFAAHPIHTEAVAGIVGRAEILATCGVLVALRVALAPAASRGSRVGPRAVFALGLVLAMFSKEIGFVVLPLIVVLGLARRDRVPDAPWLIGIAAAVAGLMLGAKFAVTGALGVPAESITAVANPAAHADAVSRTATAFAVLTNYASLLVFPDVLSYDYSFDQVSVVDLTSAKAWLGMAVAVALTALAIVGRRQLPVVAFGCAMFLLAWLPVSNVFFPIGTIQAERLLYLPSVGFVLCVAEVVRRGFGARSRVAWGIVLVVTVALAGRAVVRNFDWRDNRSLFESGIVTSPRSALTHFELGKLLFNEARVEADVRERVKLERRSAELFEEGLAIAPDGDAIALLGLAYLLERRGEVALSLERFRSARRVEPVLGAAWIGEMTAAARLGRVDAVRAAAEAMLGDDVRSETDTFGESVWTQAAATTQAVGLAEVTVALQTRAALAARRREAAERPSSP